MITSLQNPRIKRVRALQSRARTRRAEGAFVIEGVRLCEEALTAQWPADYLLYTAELSPRARQVVDGFQDQGVEALIVSDAVMRAASETQTPQGVLCVLQIAHLPIPDRLSFCLILDGVRDPGNLGTLLRTASAAGVEAVFLPPGNVDLLAPKVLRAAMGAHFHLPMAQFDWETTIQRLGAIPIYLSDAREGIPYTQADFRSPCALVIGGEAAGAGPTAQKQATYRVHIPMPGQAESLNAASAGAVLLFEVVRQRRKQPTNKPNTQP